MIIVSDINQLPQRASLILGFFDGVHIGHRAVFKTSPSCNRVLITFSKSPAEYFGAKFEYIYAREQNYQLIEKLGVDYIFERNFSEVYDKTATEYLSEIVQKLSPVAITTGFNHTFGLNKTGDSEFLKSNQGVYKYYCVPQVSIEGNTVSSTRIKELLAKGDIEKANEMLKDNFVLSSIVVEGAKLGRKLGFPTANMKYPKGIIKIPYGVYKVNVFDKPAVMNWGVKPTIGSEELMEIYIPNYSADLYGKTVDVEILSRIREEKRFNSLEELRSQIQKDVEECLK